MLRYNYKIIFHQGLIFKKEVPIQTETARTLHLSLNDKIKIKLVKCS